MNEKGKIKGIYSWPAIILAFCIFWPVGVYLIVKRISFDKKTTMEAGKVTNGIGITFYCIAVLGFVSCYSVGFGSDEAGAILFLGIAGFVLRKVSKKTKREAEDVKKYLSVIVNGNEKRIDVIASSVGKTYDEAKDDIQKLINKGYLKNAYINEGIREVVLQPVAVWEQESATVNESADNAGFKIVSCPCCGANNTVSVNGGECEYCGSPLK